MKCISCGSIISDDAKICKVCGHNLEQYKNYYKKMVVEQDPQVDESQKASLTDNPVLTFVFGLVSLLSSMLYVTYFALIFLGSSGLLIWLTLFLSKKPAKINLIPVRNFGKVLAYISLVLVVFRSVNYLIGLII